jgi:hypothetical protein
LGSREGISLNFRFPLKGYFCRIAWHKGAALFGGAEDEHEHVLSRTPKAKRAPLQPIRFKTYLAQSVGFPMQPTEERRLPFCERQSLKRQEARKEFAPDIGRLPLIPSPDLINAVRRYVASEPPWRREWHLSYLYFAIWEAKT